MPDYLYTVNMTHQSSVTEELQTLGALLRTPLDVLHDEVFAELARAGFAEVRVAHGAVFRHIARGGSRVTTLAERARMTKQSMAELVEYLRKWGHIELIPDPADGRAKLVKLTARGWKVHEQLVKSSAAFERKCARSLGEERWRVLRKLLREFAAWSQQRRSQ
jgi:DNA-binding MarR family transcriptional regulator